MNRGDAAATDELLAADYTHHDPALPSGMEASRTDDVRGFRMFPAAFPDLHTALDDIFSAGYDKVAVRWTTRGTRRGDLRGIPPTGRPVAVGAIPILRLADGRVAEGWVNFDALGMLRQLGTIPDPTAG